MKLHCSSVAFALLCLVVQAEGRAFYKFQRNARPSLSSKNKLPFQFERLRGGSTKVASQDSMDDDALRQYRMQQQLLLQARSLALRQVLIGRGLEGLQFTTSETETAKPTDWDCAVATSESPKSCLYSFDAQLGHKVVAPKDTQDWITLSALNRLRRTDPSKVEPLWHSQFTILQAWFNPNSPHSLYSYLSPRAALLSYILDAPMALGAAMAFTMVFLFLLTFPVWEALMTKFLTSSVLWLQWPSWARIVHAAFPLKLLVGQMAWKAIAGVLGELHGRVRNDLIEMECQLWEACIPRTIIEERPEEVSFGNVEAEDDDDEEEDDMSDDDDDDSDYFDAEEEDSDDDFR